MVSTYISEVLAAKALIEVGLVTFKNDLETRGGRRRRAN